MLSRIRIVSYCPDAEAEGSLVKQDPDSDCRSYCQYGSKVDACSWKNAWKIGCRADRIGLDILSLCLPERGPQKEIHQSLDDVRAHHAHEELVCIELRLRKSYECTDKSTSGK